MRTSSAYSAARDALRLADAEPRRAVAAAHEADRLGAEQGNFAARAVAARAKGLALFGLGQLDDAFGALRQALALSGRARSATLAAEAQMTRAWILASCGRRASALRAIETALSSLDGIERARALAQRGTILHQLGRFDDALVDYAAALPILCDAHDLRWVAQIRLNRGVGHAHRGSFAVAISDLRAAEKLSSDLGLTLWVANVRHNLGYVEVLRGDIPAALEHFEAAESAQRQLGSPLGPLLRDRAELLLSARLIAEAREAAEQAVAACASEGRLAILPEARLLLARVQRLQDDPSDALVQARAAADEFARLGHTEMAALARLVVLIQRLAAGGPVPNPALVERTAGATGGLWPEVPVEARIEAARAALRRGRPAQARELLAAAARGRNRGTATLRARGWYAEGLHRYLAGNARGAQSAVRAGLRILDEYAAVLGATDIRAGVATHRSDLAALGLRIAVERRSADDVLKWAERGRASHLQRAPGRPPRDARLADSLVELRMVMREIEDRRAEGRSAGPLMSRQLKLERHIRNQYWRQRNDSGAAVGPSPEALGHVLGERALVEYVSLDGVLRAVTVVEGRVRLHALGSVAAAVNLADRLPFAFHRLTRRNARAQSRQAAQDLLAGTAAQLDAILLRPLRELGDRPYVIVPTGRLQSLPWAALPSCAGRPVTVSPSASLWTVAQGRPAAHRPPFAAAGPGLPAASDEAAAVSAVYGTHPLVGAAATVPAVLAALRGSSVAHLAAHGVVRADNPLFGCLRFADGPLMIYDLEDLDAAPHTVVVAACDAGRPVVPVGDELLGLTATLLAQGSTQLIAPLLPILDMEAGPLMTALHTALAAGSPPAHALAAAQHGARADGPESRATAAAFVCFGAGFRSPFAGTTA